MLCRLAPRETQVLCKACGSYKQAKFTAEIAVHIPGLNNLEKPHLLVFPEILVCTTCGNAEFTLPESQLRILANAMLLKQGKRKTV